MLDFDPVKFFGYNESSTYSQLLRNTYVYTSPGSLVKFEPFIKRKYLQKLVVEEDDNLNNYDDEGVKNRKICETKDWLDVTAQWNIDTDPERHHWLENLLKFMEDRGTPITVSPSVPGDSQGEKRPLDLYVLFNLTMIEAGGMKQCSDNNGWRNIARKMNVPTEKYYVLSKLYKKHLLPFEEHQKNQTIKHPGPSWQSNNSQAKSQAESKSGKRKRKEDLRTRLNNNKQPRPSVFNRLGTGTQPLISNRKRNKKTNRNKTK